MTETRSISTTTIALCASLSLHALLVYAATEQFVLSESRISLPSLPRIADPDAGPIVALARIPEFSLGKRDGTGTALDDSAGDVPMQAREASQDQAFLSLDPEGPGALRAEPSRSVLPMGSGNARAGAAIPPVPRDEPTAVEDVRPLPFGVAVTEPESEGPMPKGSSTTPDQPAQPAAPPQSAASSAAGDSSTPGAPVPPANPAPEGMTESDPFATHASLEFRRGKTEARVGRRHKIVMPRFGLAGAFDFTQLGQIALTLNIRIDSSGNVMAVDILRTSGSDTIDQAWRLAAYEWWFEPRQSANGGAPSTETFAFSIIMK